MGAVPPILTSPNAAVIAVKLSRVARFTRKKPDLANLNVGRGRRDSEPADNTLVKSCRQGPAVFGIYTASYKKVKWDKRATQAMSNSCSWLIAKWVWSQGGALSDPVLAPHDDQNLTPYVQTIANKIRPPSRTLRPGKTPETEYNATLQLPNCSVNHLTARLRAATELPYTLRYRAVTPALPATWPVNRDHRKYPVLSMRN